MLTVRNRRSEDGFTLVELIITMTIIAVIVFPLGEMVITYLLNSATIQGRLYESKDQQLASQYWSSDVDSLGQRNTTTFSPSDGINTGSCGSTPAGGASVINLQWTTFSFTPPAVAATSGTTTVSYYTTPASSTKASTLVRTSCATGSAVSLTVANTLLIDSSHHVQCSTDGGTTWVACTTVTGSGSAGLSMRFYVSNLTGHGQGYWATLVGQRRQTP